MDWTIYRCGKEFSGKPREWVPERDTTLQVLPQWLEAGAGVEEFRVEGNGEQDGTLTS